MSIFHYFRNLAKINLNHPQCYLISQAVTSNTVNIALQVSQSLAKALLCWKYRKVRWGWWEQECTQHTRTPENESFNLPSVAVGYS
jgi:hypothetical protein